MAIYAATGFGAGVADLLGVDSDRRSVCINSDADYVKSGTYSLKIANGYQRIPIPAGVSDLEVNCWLHPDGAYGDSEYLRVKVVLGDATIVELRFDTDHWVAYVDGAAVATGTVITDDELQHLAVRFHINAAGHITARVEGIDDIAYVGDTLPGADANIDYVEIAGVGSVIYLDVPLICDYDTALHAAQYADLLVLNSDAAAAWSRSAGATNYEAVNPIPATTTLYVYSSVNAQDDRYGHAGWTGANKTPTLVAVHHDARKTVAVADQINQLLKSGVTTDVAAAEDLLTTFGPWLHEFYETDPDTAAAWLEAGIDAIEVGERSIII